MDDDFGDVFRRVQAFFLPRGAAIIRLVAPVTKTIMASAMVLTCATPDSVRGRGVSPQRPNGIGALPIEERGPCCPGVFGFPDTARADRDIPGCGIVWHNDNIGDTPRHECRPDIAQTEGLECCTGERSRLFVSIALRICGHRKHRRQQYSLQYSQMCHRARLQIITMRSR